MFKNKSLQWKLLFLNCAIVFVIGVAVYFIDNKFFAIQSDKTEAEFTTMANVLNQAIQAQFYERYGDVQAFAMNPKLQSKSKADVQDALDGYVALYGIYDVILVTDTGGKILFTNSKDPSGKEIKSQELVGKSVTDAEWFKNVMAGKFTEDKAKAFVGTYFEEVHVDPYVSEAYGEKRPGTSFSAQIKDASGSVIGVISNRAGSRWFEGEMMSAAQNAAKHNFDPDIRVFNSKGSIMASIATDEKTKKTEFSRDFSLLGQGNFVEEKMGEGKQLIQSKKAGSKIYIQDFDKEEVLTGYSPIEGSKWVDAIGWSVAVTEHTDQAFLELHNLKNMIYFSLSIIFFIAIAMSYYFSKTISKDLNEVVKSLLSNSAEVSNVANILAEGSNKLSSSTTEQAAALQETVASIDQVSAMVAKNADNAKRSQEISSTSAQSANRGKATVEEMIHSIENISKSNQEIAVQIEEGNRQIADIVKVITEIGNKTKVINDIVFQTKLLSFNASVEAARAGEHGKGFAVVAEEVGNLAQMSGNAAKEITQMLDTSISQVEKIVNDTKTRVEHLTAMSKEKVEAGTVVAKRCGEALDEIVQSVDQVNSMVAEIATASKEQAQGVSEINKAMNQLDQVTQLNASSAQESATSAERLKQQSEQMAQATMKLKAAVEGYKQGTENYSVPPSSASQEMPLKVVEEKIEQLEPSNVVSLTEVKKPKSKETAMKQAAGAEVIPDRDDHRFEEV